MDQLSCWSRAISREVIERSLLEEEEASSCFVVFPEPQGQSVKSERDREGGREIFFNLEQVSAGLNRYSRATGRHGSSS